MQPELCSSCSCSGVIPAGAVGPCPRCHTLGLAWGAQRGPGPARGGHWGQLCPCSKEGAAQQLCARRKNLSHPGSLRLLRSGVLVEGVVLSKIYPLTGAWYCSSLSKSAYCLQKIEQTLPQRGRLICNTKYLINTVKFHFMGTCICAVISRS